MRAPDGVCHKRASVIQAASSAASPPKINRSTAARGCRERLQQHRLQAITEAQAAREQEELRAAAAAERAIADTMLSSDAPMSNTYKELSELKVDTALLMQR